MTEIQKLDKYLTDNKIIHTYDRRWPDLDKREPDYREGQKFDGGYQIIVYDEYNNRLWDAICGYGSYGFQQGLLEIMEEKSSKVIGFLTADDVIKMIENSASNELVLNKLKE